jgi:hypothetical protein
MLHQTLGQLYDYALTLSTMIPLTCIPTSGCSLDSNIFRFFSGVAWAVVVAFVCCKSPCVTVLDVLEKVFVHLELWLVVSTQQQVAYTQIICEFSPVVKHHL